MIKGKRGKLIKGVHLSPATEFRKGVKSKNWNGFTKGNVSKEQARIAGLKGAKARWAKHISQTKKQNNSVRKWTRTSDKEIQLQKKRFRNQRYKIRKKNALGSHTFREWQWLKEYFNNTCLACGKREPEIKLTEDHIISLEEGGSDYIMNIQPLCLSCNVRKHTKSISYLPLNSKILEFNF